MTDPDSEHAAAAPRSASAPKVIKLLADWGAKLEGSVLRADDDLIGALEVEGIGFREATETERGLAGIVS